MKVMLQLTNIFLKQKHRNNEETMKRLKKDQNWGSALSSHPAICSSFRQHWEIVMVSDQQMA